MPGTHPDTRSWAGPRPEVVNLLIAVMCLIWGSTWLAIKWGLRDLPPFTSAAARVWISAGGMALVAAWLHRKEGGARPRRRLSALIGATNFAGSYGIIYWAETRLPSGLCSLLWAIFPLIMAGAGHWILPGERLRPRQALGFALGFAGVVFLHATVVEDLGGGALTAALVLVLSPVLSAVGNLSAKRFGGTTNSLLLNRDAMLVGAVLLTIPALAVERDAEIRWTPPAVLSLLYLSIVGTVVTFSLYFWLLRYAPANKLSLIAYVTPLIALAVGAALGDEHVGSHTIAGAALILGGVALAAKPRRGVSLASTRDLTAAMPRPAAAAEEPGG